MQLASKYHHPTFNHLEDIMLINKTTNNVTMLKTPPLFSMLHWWVNVAKY